ncbi:MAG: sigma-54-dependent Fis family transcriptional regulator [Syntrophobacteraceae bacterium]|jgi:transcriptional regulator of acetoin/glycerol metabolism
MSDHAGSFHVIYTEWRKFVHGIPVASGIVRPVVLDSWERCRSKGVDPYLTRVPLVLGGEALQTVLERNGELIDISRPFMEHLSGFFKGSNFIVALSDANGFLIELIGDDHIVESVKQGNFVLGACWSEEVAGSNGVGTVLALGKPLQVFGCEHFCINSRRWTCSGAPIHNAEGEMVGAIDMTGPYEKANPHTLGMVVASAHAIENEFRYRKALREIQVAHGFQKTVISSIPEIIIAIDNDGIISLMNNNAMKAFGACGDRFIGRSLEALWSRNFNIIQLIANNESLTDVEVRISSRNSQADFTLTCNPILSMNRVAGKVIILNEIKRARTLATRMMGAKAKLRFEDIIGHDVDFLETVRHAQIASRTTSNVLLLGESGTGKDIFAQAIHNGSSRRDGPYVAINLATIPRDLVTSELFGYADGAFTGSRKGGSPGKFELADGGTIFLDEIGETPLEVQAALLRVIEDKSIMRLGSTKVATVNVRIVAATNKDLKEEVRKGRFREDLYYRSNVFMIRMVPLIKRTEDIPLLVDSFLRNISRSMGKEIVSIDSMVLECFMSYQWPGNVRELQNVLERMINVAQTSELTVDLLPREIIDSQSPENAEEDVQPVGTMERELILRLLRSSLTKKDVAKKLGISRSTLYRKLDKYEFRQ